jgi:glutathione S-transferase
MKLYFTPGFCSLAIHITLLELRLDFTLVEVDMQKKETLSGEDFLQINPKGQVPYLVADDGVGLSEGPVIAQFLADKVEGNSLFPRSGTMARYRVMEWQAYIASEIHKAYLPLFHPQVNTESKAIFEGMLKAKYQWIDTVLANNSFLTGSDFTLADAYLFAITRWAGYVGLDLAGLKNIHGFMLRTATRPRVVEALIAEHRGPD